MTRHKIKMEIERPDFYKSGFRMALLEQHPERSSIRLSSRHSSMVSMAACYRVGPGLILNKKECLHGIQIHIIVLSCAVICRTCYGNHCLSLDAQLNKQ